MDSISAKAAISFLDLPGEIRNRIYRFALTAGPYRERSPFVRTENSLNLLLSNLQIKEEAASILYAERQFVAQLSPGLLQIPSLRDQPHPIRHIIIEFCWAAPCSCRPSRVLLDDYGCFEYSIRHLCVILQPHLKDLESIDVVWLESTPLPSMCYMDSYARKSKGCKLLLTTLRDFLRENGADKTITTTRQACPRSDEYRKMHKDVGFVSFGNSREIHEGTWSQMW